MFNKATILFILLLSFFTGLSRAQYVNEVCAGDNNVMYSVKGGELSEFIWTVEGGSIVSDRNDTIVVDWGMNHGDFEINVLETSPYGCSGELVTAIVKINPAPAANFNESASFCMGESINLDAGRASNYNWSTGSTERTVTVDSPGWVWVDMVSENGCRARDSILITENSLPVVDLGSDTSICIDERIRLNAGNYLSYKWSTGENSSTIFVTEGAKEIWVEVTDINGCSNTDTVNILPCDMDNPLGEIQNVITPNNDGSNDTWMISDRLESYPEAMVEVYDRWGRMIFRSEPGYSEKWNGTSMNGNELPMDSYYYIIKLDGQIKPIVGHVTIVR